MPLKFPPRHQLIGESLENFYQIGVIDADSFNQVKDHLDSLLCLNSPLLKMIQKPLLLSKTNEILKANPLFNNQMDAFSEGLKQDKIDVAFTLLLPEFISALSTLKIGPPRALFGCSSLFFLRKSDLAPTHLRILDFPLANTFETHERILTFKENGYPQIFSYGIKGLPYPGLTAMNSEGVTLALHQKFTNEFNSSGTPIFLLATTLLNEVSNSKEAIKILKKMRSITTWGIKMLFSDGKVLMADLSPSEVTSKISNLKEKEILYCNNDLLSGKESDGPLSLPSYCELRYQSAKEIITRTENIDPIKLLSNIVAQKPDSDYRLPIRTYSSVQISTLTPTKGDSLFLLGTTPKSTSAGEILSLTSIWATPSLRAIPVKFTGESEIEEGLTELALAQKYLDLKDLVLAYHHMQEAVSLLHKSTHYVIARFYFLLARYLHEKNSEGRIGLIGELLKLEESLPPHLKDHLYLFINRLQRELRIKKTVTKEMIKNKKLQKLFLLEESIPSLLLHKVVSRLTILRIDILDVIYLHLPSS